MLNSFRFLYIQIILQFIQITALVGIHLFLALLENLVESLFNVLPINPRQQEHLLSGNNSSFRQDIFPLSGFVRVLVIPSL